MKKTVLIIFMFLFAFSSYSITSYASDEDVIIDVDTDTLDNLDESSTESGTMDTITESASDNEIEKDGSSTGELTQPTGSEKDPFINDSDNLSDDNSNNINDGIFAGHEEDGKGFFAKVLEKLNTSLNAAQLVVAILIAIVFVICLLMCAFSFVGGRFNKALAYIVSALICAILFVCDLYAVEILSALKKWFMS